MKKISSLLISLSTLFGSLNGQMPFESFCSDANCETYCESTYDYAYNPPIAERLCCGLSGHIDYLFWKADLRYNSSMNTSFIESSSEENLQRLRFDWDSGFRIGVNYTVPDNAWTLDLSYTRFSAKARKIDFEELTVTTIGGRTGPIQRSLAKFPVSETLIFGSIVTPFSANPLIDSNGFLFTSFENRARLEFNDLSFIFKKEYIVGPQLSLTPFIGLKSLYIHNTNLVSFDGLSTDSGGALGVDQTEYRLNQVYRNKYTGVGVQGGLKGYWEWFCNIGIEGHAGVSLLFGSTKALITNTFSSIVSLPSGLQNNEGEVYETSFSYNEINFTLDSGIYLRWAERIFCNRGLASFKLGWEFHYISDQNNQLLYREATTSITNSMSKQMKINKIVTPTYSDIESNPLTFQGLVLGFFIEI